MAELQRAADVEQRSPEEVVEDAVERYLRLSRRKRLFAGCLHWASSGRGRTEYATPYPSRLGRTVGQVAAAIARAGAPPRGAAIAVRGQTAAMHETSRNITDGPLVAAWELVL